VWISLFYTVKGSVTVGRRETLLPFGYEMTMQELCRQLLVGCRKTKALLKNYTGPETAQAVTEQRRRREEYEKS
jgi:hypothetical protein